MRQDSTYNLKLPYKVLLSTVLYLPFLTSGNDDINRREQVLQRGSITRLTRNGASSYFLGAEGDTGPEYELVREFAKFIGVDVKVHVAGAFSQLAELLSQDQGDLIAANLTRTLTHEIDPGQWRGQAARYRDGIAPLLQARKLAAVLLQFPPSFVRAPQNRRYLAALLDELDGLPLAVEFRHASWATDRVFAELERRRTTLVAVDEPDLPGLFPRLDIVTNPGLFYIRFHGRNAKGWRSGNMQKQFELSLIHI